MRLLPYGIVLLLLGVAAVPPAQGQPRRAAAAPPDTALVAALTAAALSVAPPPEGRAPWRITVPDTLAPTWRLLERSLARALDARALAAADTMHRFLSLSDVRVAGGTLRASLVIGAAWRCPNGAWMRSSAGYRVRARRVAGRWQRPRVEQEIIADPAPCDRQPPPG